MMVLSVVTICVRGALITDHAIHGVPGHASRQNAIVTLQPPFSVLRLSSSWY